MAKGNIYTRLEQSFDSDKTFSFANLDPFSEESAWISTGSPSLNYNLKTYGYPTGIIEVRGESQSGKTTFSLHAALQNQRQYKDKAITIFLSSERRDNKPYAFALGLDIDKVLIHRVTTIEDVGNKIHQTLDKVMEIWRENAREDTKLRHKVSSSGFEAEVEKTLEKMGKPRFLFIWDSLGQTISAQEKKKLKERAETTDDKKKVAHAALGSAARSLGMILRGCVGLSDDYDMTLFVINRPYDKVDGTPGKKSFGGKAITLYPNLRLDLARIQGIKIADTEVGQITQVTTLKTDFDRPKQKFKVDILYGFGMVLTSDDIQEGIKAGILEKHGQFGASFMKGKLKWTSKKGLYQHYYDSNPMLRVLTNKLTKHFNNKFITEHKAKMNK